MNELVERLRHLAEKYGMMYGDLEVTENAIKALEAADRMASTVASILNGADDEPLWDADVEALEGSLTAYRTATQKKG